MQTPHSDAAQAGVVVLGTGGTIAGVATGDPSLPGYTAAVLGVDALIERVPMLQRLARLHTEQVVNIDSKDMDCATWSRLAMRVAHWLAQPEIAACVITHGTDTLEETAYFLQLVHRSDKPVVLTAAMRPATALDADGPQNLLDAVRVAVHPQARGLGVVCVLHGRIHAAHDVTKANPHRIDAFSSGERGPLGEIDGDRLRLWRRPEAEPGAPFAVPPADAWPRVDIVLSHAGADGALVHSLLRDDRLDPPLRGLVVAGTGGGTVHQRLQAALQWAEQQGVRVQIAPRIGPLRGGAADGLTAVKLRVRMLLELAASG
jgi:L-asparaginase